MASCRRPRPEDPARRHGVQALRDPSARDPGGGVNVAVLDVGAFGRSRPRGFETWYSASTRRAVEFKRRDFGGGRVVRFAREVFLVEGELPAPAARGPGAPPRSRR